jgi:hypothetical protein
MFKMCIPQKKELGNFNLKPDEKISNIYGLLELIQLAILYLLPRSKKLRVERIIYMAYTAENRKNPILVM